MKGYVNFTLATSPHQGWGEVGKTECRYRAFRDHEGSFTPSHYKILGLKLAFVIIFEVSTNAISSCQRNLMKTYHNEADTSRIIKIVLKFFFTFSDKEDRLTKLQKSDFQSHFLHQKLSKSL